MGQVTKIRLIVFDLDDTLIDTSTAIESARQTILELLSQHLEISLGHALFVWRRLNYLFGYSDPKGILRALVWELGGNPDLLGEVIHSSIDIYFDRFYKSIRPVPRAQDTLNRLQELGLAAALLTNGEYNHQMRKLEASGLSKFFPSNLIGIHPPDSALAKPNKAGLISLCSTAGININSVAFVGNQTTDVVTANLAGCVSVRYTFLMDAAESSQGSILNVETPDFVIHDLIKIVDVASGDF